MIREPGICVFSFRIFVRCLLQMEEHAQQEGQCTVTCWAMQFACAWHYTAVRLATAFFLRYCCDTASHTRTHHSEVCCEATSCASRSHRFRVSGPVCAKRNAQRVPRQLGVAMGAGAAMRRGPALIQTCFRGCVLVRANHIAFVAVVRCRAHRCQRRRRPVPWAWSFDARPHRHHVQ